MAHKSAKLACYAVFSPVIPVAMAAKDRAYHLDVARVVHQEFMPPISLTVRGSRQCRWAIAFNDRTLNVGKSRTFTN
nr:hypothetical protein [uncultured Ruegeria sp.]